MITLAEVEHIRLGEKLYHLIEATGEIYEAEVIRINRVINDMNSVLVRFPLGSQAAFNLTPVEPEQPYWFFSKQSAERFKDTKGKENMGQPKMDYFVMRVEVTGSVQPISAFGDKDRAIEERVRLEEGGGKYYVQEVPVDADPQRNFLVEFEVGDWEFIVSPTNKEPTGFFTKNGDTYSLVVRCDTPYNVALATKDKFVSDIQAKWTYETSWSSNE